MIARNAEKQVCLKPPCDKIGIQLDVLEAEQRTMESERLQLVNDAEHDDSLAYLEGFCLRYAPIIQCSRKKVDDSNELELNDNAESYNLFMPAPSLFLSHHVRLRNDPGSTSGAVSPVGVSQQVPGTIAAHSAAPSNAIAHVEPHEMSPVQNNRPRKRRLTHSKPTSTRRRLLSNHIDVPQLLRLGALSVPDLSVTEPNLRLSRWEAHGRHGHAANIMLRSHPVLVLTARHSPPAAWRTPDTLISVTLSLMSRDASESTALQRTLHERADTFIPGRGPFFAECSCKPSTILFRSIRDDISESEDNDYEICEHIEVVVSVFWRDSRLTKLGIRLEALLNQVSSTNRNDTSATSSAFAATCSNSQPQTAFAVSISVSPILSDIVAVVWEGKKSQRGAAPVLVTLSKRQNESDVNMKIACYACVANTRPDCPHETACCFERDSVLRNFISQERDRLRGSVDSAVGESIANGGRIESLRSLAEVGTQDAENLHESSEFDCSHESDVAQDCGDFINNEDLASEERENASSYGTPVSGKPFQSWARRPPLPCLADRCIISTRAKSVHDSSRVDMSTNSKQVETVRLVDEYGQCSNRSCRMIAFPLEHKSALRRKVTLIQFDGAHEVEVRDWICRKCGHVNRFEGLDTGTFSMTKTSIFCRRVLDFLVACTLRRCMTGRGAYEAFIDSQKASAEAYGGSNGIVELRSVGRREFAEAMSAFVSVLGDAPGNPGSISSLFTCCGGEMACGDKAIAIDASASGILAKLPLFEKDELEVECLSTRHNSKQHLLRGLHEREGVRHLLRLSLLSLSRSKKLGDFLLEEDNIDTDFSERMHGTISEEEAVFDLSKLASKLCQAKPATRRARREAVVALVAPHISRIQRDSRSEHAGELNTRCDADCIEAEPGAEEIEEEAHELQDLASTVSSQALNDVFIFWNSEDDLPEAEPAVISVSVQPEPTEPIFLPSDPRSTQEFPLALPNILPERVPVAQDLSVHHVATQQLQVQGDDVRLTSASEDTLSPSEGQEHVGTALAAVIDAAPETVDVASRRSNVDVSLFTAYVTLLIMLLSDPIEAVWGGCTVATETWIREVCGVLLDLGACDGLPEARGLLVSLHRVARRGFGQCPSLLRFLKELSDLLTDTHVTNGSREDNDWRVCLLLAQSIGRLCLIAVRQCRLFSRVSSFYATNSAAAYAEKHKDPIARPYEPWSLDEGRRTGHFYPGRVPARPGVSLSGHSHNCCSKQYVASSGPSPGIVVATCVCGNKIVNGFSLLVSKESLGIIATVLLRYFPNTSIVYYDAACNLFSSLVNRFPWLTNRVRFLVDVFHKLGHTCGVTFCALTQRGAQGAHQDPRTSNVESANQQIAGIRPSLLRTRPANAIALLTMRFVFINLLSLWRLETGSDDTEDAELGGICNRKIQCRCRRCTVLRAASGEEGDIFARDEAELHSTLYKVGPPNSGANANRATEITREAEAAHYRAELRFRIGDRRLIGSLGGRT